ncbi:hypothetical protein ACF3OC_07930 [Sphingobacterium cellulitidis]|uniref:hypothetical protein n=1 Tax=Sphingobacterium cellulitidis TaxID=1768011 RepID=UPI00370D7025
MEKSGLELIAREREEQLKKHGRTIESDVQENRFKELAQVASALAYPHHYADDFDDYPENWDREILANIIQKPYKERLIIAGALIAAELDRLIRIGFDETDI